MVIEMDFDALLNQLLSKKFGDDLGEKVERELAKNAKPAREELLEELLTQYRTLLTLLRVKTPCAMKLSADDLGVLAIDGKSYDLDACFSHRDRQATECRMAIEALFCDLREVSTDIERDTAYIEQCLCAL